MNKKTLQIDNELLDRKEKEGWEKWNQEYKEPDYTPEQILTWLDNWRAFMFEIWKNDPSLRKEYEKLNR